MLVTHFAKIFPFTTQLRKFGTKRQEVTGHNTAQKLFHLHAGRMGKKYEKPTAFDPIEQGHYDAFCMADKYGKTQAVVTFNTSCAYFSASL